MNDVVVTEFNLLNPALNPTMFKDYEVKFLPLNTSLPEFLRLVIPVPKNDDLASLRDIDKKNISFRYGVKDSYSEFHAITKTSFDSNPWLEMNVGSTPQRQLSFTFNTNKGGTSPVFAPGSFSLNGILDTPPKPAKDDSELQITFRPPGASGPSTFIIEAIGDSDITSVWMDVPDFATPLFDSLKKDAKTIQVTIKGGSNGRFSFGIHFEKSKDPQFTILPLNSSGTWQLEGSPTSGPLKKGQTAVIDLS